MGLNFISGSSAPPFSRYEGTELVSYKKIGLTLLEQCRAEGLTVDQALFVLKELKRKIKDNTKNQAV